jgi:hypothetical protein
MVLKKGPEVPNEGPVELPVAEPAPGTLGRRKKPPTPPLPPEPPVPPTPVPPVPIAPDERTKFIGTAEAQVGKPYVWATAGPSSFDCSGLVYYCYKQATGKEISRSSYDQVKLGTTVARGQEAPGDLVFWDTEHNGTAGHVGILANDRLVINALNSSTGVIRARLDGQYGGPYLGARRLFASAPAPTTDVTPSSPFRTLGNTDKASFRAALSRSVTRAASPMALEANEIYDVLAPLGLTRLAAAMCWIERSNETNPDGLSYYPWSYHNAWAVKKAGGWAQYPSYTEAARDWGSLVLGEVYKDLTSLSQFIQRYAPWSDGNNPSDYGRKAALQINALPRIDTPVQPDLPIVFGNAKHPEYERKIVDKRWVGAGYDPVDHRTILGLCDHQWWGYGDKDALVRLFGTGGERQADALTDYSCTFEGELVMLNDPRGKRSPWANGAADDLDADISMAPTFIGAVRECVQDHGFATCHEGQQDGGHFLVAYDGRLYAIGCDSVMEPVSNGVTAIGCGSYYALSALHAMPDLDPVSRIQRALSITSDLDPHVGPPFQIARLSGQPVFLMLRSLFERIVTQSADDERGCHDEVGALGLCCVRIVLGREARAGGGDAERGRAGEAPIGVLGW